MALPTIDWTEESARYDEAHLRLVEMGRLVSLMPSRRVLDIGCSTAKLKQVLGDGFEYFGCDIADIAGHVLDGDHFRQIDFNRSVDLSAFHDRGIGTIHVGGVVEYLVDPEALLRAARQVVAGDGRMVLSIINFEAARYRDPAGHHFAWIYKPAVAEFLKALDASGWKIEEVRPFYRGGRARRLLRSMDRRYLDAGSRQARRDAEQFIILASAR